MFVDSASYILRATVGGKAGAKDGRGSATKAKRAGKPLWDPKQLQVGDNFSCISYLNVTNIDGNKVTVKNHLGGSWFISKDLLVRDTWSADHFDKEVKCTMTDLSEILESSKDTIFKVSFRRKVDNKSVEQKLNEIKFADLKKNGQLQKLSKKILEGDSVEITGHLVRSEGALGRSLVIDLNAPKYNNFRQVDHRAIDYIIFRNVKYSLGRKSPTEGELPLKHDKTQPRWNES